MILKALKQLLRCFKPSKKPTSSRRVLRRRARDFVFHLLAQSTSQFLVSGSLSLEGRKAKIASLKSRTTCRRCGAVGHWSGEGGRYGKFRPGSSSSSSQASTTASKGSPAKPRTAYFAVHELTSAGGSHGYMALRGEGFHAVPPPSSLTGQHEHALHGPPHEHALHGPPHENALHEPPHGHVPHDALVPAHDSLVPAENRPQWVNLPPGEVGDG